MSEIVQRIAITGASSEIGIAIAKALAQPHVELHLQAHAHTERLEVLRLELACPVVIHSVDLSNENEAAAFALQIQDCDTLVNGAACTITDLLPNLSLGDIQKMLAVNVTSLVLLCQQVVQGMMRRRKGCIVNLSSITAQRAHRGQTVYAGTKGFVESFSRALAAEAAPRGVRVNCVAPGAIEAGSLRPLLADAPDEIKAGVALKRLGTPEDVAQAVAYLCSPAASFITGQVLAVNGGNLRGM